MSRDELVVGRGIVHFRERVLVAKLRHVLTDFVGRIGANELIVKTPLKRIIDHTNRKRLVGEVGIIKVKHGPAP